MSIGPYMTYVLYTYIFYPLYKKGVLVVQNFVFMHLQQFLAILAIKMADFFKARKLFKTIFEN